MSEWNGFLGIFPPPLFLSRPPSDGLTTRRYRYVR